MLYPVELRLRSPEKGRGEKHSAVFVATVSSSAETKAASNLRLTLCSFASCALVAMMQGVLRGNS
jgi:hypothetical protein